MVSLKSMLFSWRTIFLFVDTNWKSAGFALISKFLNELLGVEILLFVALLITARFYFFFVSFFSSFARF
jgi:hypothetical protein